MPQRSVTFRPAIHPLQRCRAAHLGRVLRPARLIQQAPTLRVVAVSDGLVVIEWCRKARFSACWEVTLRLCSSIESASITGKWPHRATALRLPASLSNEGVRE
jgi:hypothetical protein